MKASVIIPARYGSSRFPGKPLAKIKNKEMIIHVAERASMAKEISEVLVATDSDKIADVVNHHGFKAVMTSTSHHSGTDRVAEASSETDSQIIVNLQGDEPLIDPAIIDISVREMKQSDDASVYTFKKAITEKNEIEDINVVKVVTDKNDFALYFSRFPIPYINKTVREDILLYKHIGIYTFKKDFLPVFSSLSPSPLEIAESLEQLRILENGFKIKVLETKYNPLSVDTPEDLISIERFIT